LISASWRTVEPVEALNIQGDVTIEQFGQGRGGGHGFFLSGEGEKDCEAASDRGSTPDGGVLYKEVSTARRSEDVLFSCSCPAGAGHPDRMKIVGSSGDVGGSWCLEPDL
jgi:hypothetical protein